MAVKQESAERAKRVDFRARMPGEELTRVTRVGDYTPVSRPTAIVGLAVVGLAIVGLAN